MRATALLTRTIAAGRRGLVLLAALCFVLSGMASIHTAHALSGGHDAAHAMPADTGDGHCDNQNKPAADATQDVKFSCCAFACAPLMVLNQTQGLPLLAIHGEAVLPPPQRLVLSQSRSGLFRPPRQNA
jgi:hypothetical protein